MIRALLNHARYLMRPSDLVRTESMRRHNAFRDLVEGSTSGATSKTENARRWSDVNDRTASSTSLLPRRGRAL
jgi:hypothetical protein